MWAFSYFSNGSLVDAGLTERAGCSVSRLVPCSCPRSAFRSAFRSIPPPGVPFLSTPGAPPDVSFLSTPGAPPGVPFLSTPGGSPNASFDTPPGAPPGAQLAVPPSSPFLSTLKSFLAVRYTRGAEDAFDKRRHAGPFGPFSGSLPALLPICIVQSVVSTGSIASLKIGSRAVSGGRGLNCISRSQLSASAYRAKRLS